MTRKHFIALAKKIKTFTTDKTLQPLTDKDWVNFIAEFCADQNPNFDKDRFLNACKGE